MHTCSLHSVDTDTQQGRHHISSFDCKDVKYAKKVAWDNVSIVE